MTKDIKPKMNKTDNVKRSKRIEEQNRKKKQHQNSSDDDCSNSSESEEELDPHEYRKFLSTIFPSKHMDKKIKAGEKLKELMNKKKVYESDSESDSENELEESSKQKKSPVKKTNIKHKSKFNKKDKKKINYSSSSDNSYDSENDSEYDDVNSNSKKNKNSGKKFNIIFSIGNSKYKNDEHDYDDDDWETLDEDDSDYDSVTEDEDESVSSDSDTDSFETISEGSESEEEYKKEEEEDDEKEEEELIKRKHSHINKKTTSSKNKTNESINSKETVETPNMNNDELIQILKGLQTKGNSSETITEFIKICEDKEKTNKKKAERKIQKQKDKNERIFRKILSDKNTMNDYAFFNKMEPEQQIKIIKELREINTITRIEKPYRLTLLESNIPSVFKAVAMKKVSSLRYMEPGSGEFYKIKNWTDTFMRIPFGKIEKLSVNISDGVDICHEFMEKAKNTLDEAVYGLNDAKMQIMQLLGQLITNPSSIGTAIAIHGPPGTGKTSLVKEGISKILNRPFAFIALGGATDSSFLEGHSYTYEGSMWGKIVQILIDSKCMNPVIYFDELDKISDTPKGEEIAGILTHLTDTSQNSQFHDKYFAEIDFDLSKCLFIFSYNDESKVNPILRDRMYRIQTKGYDKKQKLTISNNYLLPKIREQVKFEEKDIIIPDESIQYIVENYCSNEDGVRNLKRCLEIIYTKLNLYRLMKPGSNLFEQEMSMNVTFPFTVTKQFVDKLIKINKDNNYLMNTMYI
jgi:ATP-dependent Lon protease